MQKTIKLSSDTALKICCALGTLLRDKDTPKNDKDNIFKMIEGIKQFMTREDFDEYVKTMELVEKNQGFITNLTGKLSNLFNKKREL